MDQTPRILSFYLGKRVLLGTFVVQIALTIPVVLSALFHQLPPAALRGGLLGPALIGTLPTVTYIALPISVGVAAALEFSRMTSEGMVAVLYSLRLSAWSIARPAIVCALGATALGYLCSCWFAPRYVGAMHDVLNVIRHSLNHRMLEPGQFYSFDEGRRIVYFEKWETPDIAANVFIRQRSDEKKVEETITASRAEFRRNDFNVVMILTHGQIQSRPDDGRRVRVSDFDEYAISLPMQGAKALPSRNWKGVFELNMRDFFAYMKYAMVDRRNFAEWASEAVKRLVIPALALAHTLLGIGLVLNVASATGRRSAAGGAVVAVLPAVHIGILVAAETLIRANPALAIFVVGLAVAEMACGVWLIQRQQIGDARKATAAVPALAGA